MIAFYCPQNKYLQACKAGDRLVHLPAHCQLTYGDNTSPELMSLIEKVPQELWGAKLALQVHALLRCNLAAGCSYLHTAESCMGASYAVQVVLLSC